jgi:chromosome partitioning protein
MPTTAFVNPKGGVGKTTSVVVIATQIAKKGARVTIIDADPNYPIQKWADGGNCPENLTIISGVTENNIAEKIREAAKADPFVLVDLEGTAAKIVVHALQESDFVVVPMRGSYLDASEAGKAVALVLDQELAVRRHVPDYKLPYSLLLTCTPPAYTTRNMKSLRKSLEDKGIPVFSTELTEREAFKSIFFFKQSLEGLDPKETPNVPKAIANAEALAAELIDKLSEGNARG